MVVKVKLLKLAKRFQLNAHKLSKQNILEENKVGKLGLNLDGKYVSFYLRSTYLQTCSQIRTAV